MSIASTPDEIPTLDLVPSGISEGLVYYVRGICRNCGWAGRIRIMKGEAAPGTINRVPGQARGMHDQEPATCENCDLQQVYKVTGRTPRG